MHEGLGLHRDGQSGWRILKLDEDQASEGVVVYTFKGALAVEDLKYSLVRPDDLGKRWGAGIYLILDLRYRSTTAQEICVVMDEPTFSEYEEPEEDEEPDSVESIDSADVL